MISHKVYEDRRVDADAPQQECHLFSLFFFSLWSIKGLVCLSFECGQARGVVAGTSMMARRGIGRVEGAGLW